MAVAVGSKRSTTEQEVISVLERATSSTRCRYGVVQLRQSGGFQERLDTTVGFVS